MTDRTARDVGEQAALSLSLDTVFELLANRRRRFALYTLSNASDGVIELATLIEDVVTLDAALAETAVTRDQYLSIGTDLYTWHLPVLADVGIVDYDARHQTIRYQRHPPLETWLTRAKQDELR